MANSLSDNARVECKKSDTQPLEEQEALIIARVNDWLTQIVIGLNFCPFAKAPHLNEAVDIRVCWQEQTEAVLCYVAECLHVMGQIDTSDLETMLIVLPHGVDDFDSYTTLVALVNQLIDTLTMRGVYQVASFHPDYCFEGSHASDISNLTNQSPYPIIHIIREDSISQQVKGERTAEAIVQANQKTLQSLSAEERKQLFGDF